MSNSMSEKSKPKVNQNENIGKKYSETNSWTKLRKRKRVSII